MVKTIIVTGATSGIGLATALKLAETNNVLAIGRNRNKLAELDLNTNIKTIALDLSSPAFIIALDNYIEQNGIEPIGFVHSAGMGMSASFDNYDYNKAQALFNVNTHSAFQIIKSTLPAMLQAKRGHICLIGSTASVYGYKYNGVYAASKHAVIGAVKSLAKEHGKRGIVVTAVCPGMTDTPMTDKMIASMEKHKNISEKEAEDILGATNPQNRIFDVSEIVDTIVFAMSAPLAASGTTIMLGGGE